MKAFPGLILSFNACRLTLRKRQRTEPGSSFLPRLGLVLLCTTWAFAALAQNRPPAPDPVIIAAEKAQVEGRIEDAEKLLIDAIHSTEQTDPESRKLAVYLRDLSNIYNYKRQYSEAMALARRALELDQKVFGPSGSATAGDLTMIADILRAQGKSEEAEQLLKQAIDFARRDQNPEAIFELLSSLGLLYTSENRWAEAEPMLQGALEECAPMETPQRPTGPSLCDGIRIKLTEVYGKEGRPVEPGQKFVPNRSDRPAELDRLDKAAQQYMKDGLYVQAEITYKKTIAWIEQNPKTETRSPVHTVHYWLGALPGIYFLLGQTLEKQGLKNEAEESYKKSIELQEAQIDPKLPINIISFNFSGLLNLYRQQGRLSEIEPIIQHAFEIQEETVGDTNTPLADTLLTLADVYREEGKKDDSKYADAAKVYERALKIQEANLGPDHPQLLRTLTGYVTVLHALHDDAKAAELQARLDMIRKQAEAKNSHN